MNLSIQLVEQNSTLKKDVAIAERKLLARNERIANLEILLSDAQDEIHASERRFEERYEAVRKGLSKGVGKHYPFINPACSFARFPFALLSFQFPSHQRESSCGP